jgi:hypothetical protein
MSLSFVTKPKTTEPAVLQEVKTTEGTLVLLDPASSKEPTFENLSLRQGRRIKWRAELPQAHDAFVSVQLTKAGQIEAQTWQGLRVVLDFKTGKITSREFVK